MLFFICKKQAGNVQQKKSASGNQMSLTVTVFYLVTPEKEAPSTLSLKGWPLIKQLTTKQKPSLGAPPLSKKKETPRKTQTILQDGIREQLPQFKSRITHYRTSTNTLVNNR